MKSSKTYAISMKSGEESKKPKRLKSMQVFIVAGSIFLTLIVTVLCMGIMIRYEVDSDVSSVESISYWNDELPSEQQFFYDQAIDELHDALAVKVQKHKANNLILFVANGISADALANVRFEGDTNGKQMVDEMSWEKFPYFGKLKNGCSGKAKCDYFTASTALYGGVKTTSQIGGLDAAVKFRDCSVLTNKAHYVRSILEQALEIDMRTGFVTTQRVTAPAVAALYAHIPDTSWECDANMNTTTDCKDIALQLITSETGKAMHVILGGGRQTLVGNVATTAWDPIDVSACKAADNRNLLNDWQQQKQKQSKRHRVLQTKEELSQLNGSATDYVLGVFANGNIQRNITQMPQPREMVFKALDVLKRPKSNYVLIIETGDQTESSIELQTQRLLELNELIETTLKDYKSMLDETLLLVLFTDSRSENDGNLLTPTEQHVNVNATANDDGLAEYIDNIISDSVIHASGPRAHIFNGLHESTYMAHAISYALEMGQFKQSTKGKS